jgi:hypothetical protein
MDLNFAIFQPAERPAFQVVFCPTRAVWVALQDFSLADTASDHSSSPTAVKVW